MDQVAYKSAKNPAGSPKKVEKQKITFINPVIFHSQEDTDEEDNQSLDQKTRKGLTNRELLPKGLSKIKFNPELQPGDWKDGEQLINIHKFLKDMFTWSMDNKMFSMEASNAEVGITTKKICLKKMACMDLTKEMKGWNTNKNFKLLEEREPGSHKSHRDIFANLRARSDSSTPRYGRRSPISPTAIQQFQDLQAKERFIQS
ncbi:hypothetical protein O181_017670 [Austropuccinia psidii MF-1]|uniref:Uncharacterized protein n=1 Tax=Austropuccinia psidii MF-1 TaxID=1389203 RepID=A0A9Q3GT92_9BASI|nr:hypothetical protein [Austropuccinia psidii MF-1]